MGRLHNKGVLENHLKDRLSRLVHRLSTTCEERVENPSVWKESLTWNIPWIRSVRGWNLEG